MYEELLKKWKIVKLGKTALDIRENPYLRHRRYNVSHTIHGKVNTDKGEIQETSSEDVKYHTTRYQVLVDAFLEQQLGLYNKLSKKALVVYNIVKTLAQFNKDQSAVRLKYTELVEYMPNFELSKVLFYRAIKELIDLGVLKKSSQAGVYWFDINLFFCGSRSALIEDFNDAVKLLGPIDSKEKIE